MDVLALPCSGSGGCLVDLDNHFTGCCLIPHIMTIHNLTFIYFPIIYVTYVGESSDTMK